MDYDCGPFEVFSFFSSTKAPTLLTKARISLNWVDCSLFIWLIDNVSLKELLIKIHPEI